LEALAGAYRLHPGQHPAITGTRPILQTQRLRSLLQGRCATQAVTVVGDVFTMCAHAHRRTAAAALALAQSGHVGVPRCPSGPDDPIFLLETARDHLRSMALDWPQRWGVTRVGAAQLAWLKGCPLPLAGPLPARDDASAWQTLGRLSQWLCTHVLQQDATHWLHTHRAPTALTQWCQTQETRLLPAHCLTSSAQQAGAALPLTQGLDVLMGTPEAQRDALLALAHAMRAVPDFCQFPQWRGQCAETGPWTRVRHVHLPGPATAWQRLAARWIELVEIATTQPSHCGPALLAHGALRTGEQGALAWCEMARGLLVHWVQCNADGTVQDYRVLAPTEWNFHPHGSLGLALQGLAHDDRSSAQRLAAAFDPCVACSV